MPSSVLIEYPLARSLLSDARSALAKELTKSAEQMSGAISAASDRVDTAVRASGEIIESAIVSSGLGVEYGLESLAFAVEGLGAAVQSGIDQLAIIGETQLSELRAIHDTLRHPRRAEADELVESATWAYRAGFLDKAERGFTEALEINEYEFRASFHLGARNLLRGHLWPALHFYREAANLALAPVNPGTTRQVIQRFLEELDPERRALTKSLVQDALKRGRHGLAAKIVHRAIGGEPLSSFWGGQALLGVARTMSALGKQEEAVAAAMHAIGLLPDRADALYELARCTALAGDDFSDISRAALTEAFFLSPELVDAMARGTDGDVLPMKAVRELSKIARKDAEDLVRYQIELRNRFSPPAVWPPSLAYQSAVPEKTGDDAETIPELVHRLERERQDELRALTEYLELIREKRGGLKQVIATHYEQVGQPEDVLDAAWSLLQNRCSEARRRIGLTGFGLVFPTAARLLAKPTTTSEYWINEPLIPTTRPTWAQRAFSEREWQETLAASDLLRQEKARRLAHRASLSGIFSVGMIDGAPLERIRSFDAQLGEIETAAVDFAERLPNPVSPQMRDRARRTLGLPDR